MTPAPQQRLLLVHAHPDDETIGQGATMAKYVAEGRGVTLVTCTGGEMGEILVPELEHLAADQDDALGEHRRGELDDAMKELGRHRPPLPRRLRPLPRLRHAVARGRPRGRRRRRPRERLLERRPHRGRRPPGRGDPRGPPAGAGHLRPVRRLRPPRPHPGAPGRDVRRRSWPPCRPTGRDLGEAWDIAKIYWGAMSESRMREGLRRAARGRATPRPSRAWTPTARCRRSSSPTTTSPRWSTRGDYAERKMARDAGARHPDHRRRPVLRAVQQRRQRRCGAPSSTGSPRARPGRSSDDGLETDLFAGLA